MVRFRRFHDVVRGTAVARGASHVRRLTKPLHVTNGLGTFGPFRRRGRDNWSRGGRVRSTPSMLNGHSVARHRQTFVRTATLIVVSLALIFAAASTPIAGASLPASSLASLSARGNMDCNGFSPVQKPLRPNLCTDIRGILGVDNSNPWGGKFYDNGHYIGHDEPDITFLSGQKGSGNDVTWTESIGTDPAGTPTVNDPGKNIADWYELSPAPWFWMAWGTPYSTPTLNCC